MKKMVVEKEREEERLFEEVKKEKDDWSSRVNLESTRIFKP